MQELKSKLNDLSEDVEAYVEAFYELKVLKISEKASLAASQGIIVSLQVALLFFILLFSSIGLAWWIGLALNNMVAGFFIVAGVHTLLLGAVISLRKVFIPKFRNTIIKKIFE